MKKLLLFVCAVFFTLTVLVGNQASTSAPDASPCQFIAKKLKLPVKFKTRGKPRRARWEQVDKVLNELHAMAKNKSCSFVFSEVFSTRREDLYIPVTNSLVRLVPEMSLQGAVVFHKSGEKLGEYAGRVTYERTGNLQFSRSYKLYYFQFKDSRGELQSAGSQLLLDDYLVRWSQLKGQLAVVVSE